MKIPCWLSLLLVVGLFLCGCAGKKPPAIAYAPTNPDVPAVLEPVRQAKASNGKAYDSAARVVKIVEKIVPAPGQERLIESLRFELATTVEQLRLTSDQLDTALLKIPVLEKQVEDMKTWGIAQQSRADTESDRATAALAKVEAERERANKEYQARQQSNKERDFLAWSVAALGTVAILLGFHGPITRFAASFNPLLGLLIWGGISAAVFAGIITAVKILLHFIV